MENWTEVFNSGNTQEEVTPPTPKDPDWQELLRNAEPGPEKWRVLSAKEAYDQERQHQKHSEAMQEKSKEIEAVLKRRPQDRTKEYYDRLQKENGSLYYRPEIQKQKALDRKEMGLIWHLKKGPVKWN